MKAILKKFFEEVKEWFADAADHIKLFVIGSRIEALKEGLDWEKHLGWPIDPKDLVMIDLWSEAYNDVLLRIRARDAQEKQEAVAQ
jgi:hypothetical protein